VLGVLGHRSSVQLQGHVSQVWLMCWVHQGLYSQVWSVGIDMCFTVELMSQGEVEQVQLMGQGEVEQVCYGQEVEQVRYG
jgi:hypothetical protein